MGVVGWIAAIVAGLLFGWLISSYAVPGTLKNRAYPGGFWAALVVGLIGGLIGAFVPGSWGWVLDGANMIAAIIISIVLTYVIGLFGKTTGAESSSNIGQ